MHRCGPMIIVVMGVSGSGKTAVGRALAQRLKGEFLEGDAFHPSVNVEKMQRGEPLADQDRSKWLVKLGQVIAARVAEGTPVPTVISCSALKKSYRDRLRRADRSLQLVYLTGSPMLLAERLQRRRDHFMPPSLLPSQLATLEPPGDDESPIVAEISSSVARIVDQVCAALLHRQRG